jgi:outer membrane protein
MKEYLIIFALFFVGCEQNVKEIAVVDIGKLYTGYDGRKIIENKYLEIVQNNKNIRDSLVYIIENVSTSLSSEERNEIQTEIIKKETKLNEIQIELQQQIWNQLNEYVRNYGDEMSYKIIIGARNDGHVLYSKSSIDITDDLLNYVNNKFKRLK